MRLPSETASHHLIIVIFRSHSAVTTGISVVPSSNTDNTTCAKRGSTASQCAKLLTPRISFTDDTIGKVPRIYCISHETRNPSSLYLKMSALLHFSISDVFTRSYFFCILVYCLFVLLSFFNAPFFSCMRIIRYK